MERQSRAATLQALISEKEARLQQIREAPQTLMTQPPPPQLQQSFLSPTAATLPAGDADTDEGTRRLAAGLSPDSPHTDEEHPESAAPTRIA